jgi:hypothetical protein
MAIVVTLKTPRTIIANGTSIVSQEGPTIVLKNNPAALATNRLAALSDVNMNGKPDGGSLQYQTNTQIFVLEPDIDGGIF